MNPFMIKEAVEAVAKNLEIPSFAGQSFNADKTGFNCEKGFSDISDDVPDFSENNSEAAANKGIAEQINLNRGESDGIISNDENEQNQPSEVPEVTSPWDNIEHKIDPETGRAQYELVSVEDKAILNSVPPPANADIRVRDYEGENYTIYKTDDQGRLSEVSRPIIEIIPEDHRLRDSNQTQKTFELKDGKCDEDGNRLDDGGHVVADEFGGSSEQVNLIPLDSEVNRHGEYRLMEKDIESALKNGDEVTDFNVTFDYEDDSQRPSGMTYSYCVNGEDTSNYITNSRAA